MKKIFCLFLLSIGFVTNVFCSEHVCPEGHDCKEARRTAPRGKGASGKWVDEETQKREWKSVGFQDLGRGNYKICGMCERERIRFIHRLRHEKQTEELDVGCICAGYMEAANTAEDEEREIRRKVKLRHREFVNLSGKRERFPTLKKWKVEDGNHSITHSEHKIVISSKQLEGDVVYSTEVDDNILSPKFETVKEAKLAAFDQLYAGNHEFVKVDDD